MEKRVLLSAGRQVTSSAGDIVSGSNQAAYHRSSVFVHHVRRNGFPIGGVHLVTLGIHLPHFRLNYEPWHQIRLFIAIVVLACIAGCATGPQFRPDSAPPPDAARVYVYRLKHYNLGAGVVPNTTPYRIKMNDGREVNLSNGGYYSFLARPGTNTLGSHMVIAWPVLVAMVLNDKELLRTEFKPGETYYLKFEVGTWGSKMTVVDKAVGEAEIQKCKLIFETN
jgi:hypothetical protein